MINTISVMRAATHAKKRNNERPKPVVEVKKRRHIADRVNQALRRDDTKVRGEPA